MKWTEIDPGKDAIFFPPEDSFGDEVAIIIYVNECANEGNGSVEIEYVDAERILKINEVVEGNAEEFFDLLPDYFQGEWCYVDNAGIYKEIFQEWIDKYYTADFVNGRDGGIEEEHKVLVEWAKKMRNK